ncbi:MAG: InlB B-repeat-containing protein [Lachnospiraceae bacterium]|nr:InlB B-repeat-containing protein [Lachnospiraceae bacterium]
MRKINAAVSFILTLSLLGSSIHAEALPGGPSVSSDIPAVSADYPSVSEDVPVDGEESIHEEDVISEDEAGLPASDNAKDDETSSDTPEDLTEDGDEEEIVGAVTSQITVTGGVEGVDYTKDEDGTLTVMSSTPLVLDGGGKTISTEQIVLGVSDNEADINVTIKDLNITKTSSTAPIKIIDNFKKDVNLTIEGTNELKAGANCAGIEKNSVSSDGILTINGNGSLVVTGGSYGAGIGSGKNKHSANIVIESGTIIAKSSDAAGIGGGGGDYDYCDSIIISGGTIKSSGYPSGIKADKIVISAGMITSEGKYHGIYGKDITILGGSVKARGERIGIGYHYSYYNVTDGSISITGGTVTAVCSYDGVSIGSDYGDNKPAICIRNASVKTIFDQRGNSFADGQIVKDILDEEGKTVYPISVPHYGNTNISYKLHSSSSWINIHFPSIHDDDDKYYLWLPEGIYDLKSGTHEWTSVPIHGNTVNVSTRKIIFDDILGSRLDIISNDKYMVDDIVFDCSSATDKYCIEQLSSEPILSRHIVISDANEIKIKNLNLQPTEDYAALAIFSKTDLEMKVEGTNTFISPSGCAGIEKPLETGNLTITGTGMIIAKGGRNGAGIGGGNSRETQEYQKAESNFDTSNIVISGCSISANGGVYAAGIGGGYNGDGSNIMISGGTVTATGESSGAGIGGGYTGDGSNIMISGGTVTATGRSSGAGIGGGSSGDGSNITISGGTVTATGGSSGAGIGGGSTGDGSNITISGGNINVKSSYGIGAGYSGSGSYATITTNIYISGGNIKASKIGTTPKVSATDNRTVSLNKVSGYLAGDPAPFETIKGAAYYNLEDIVAHDDGCFYLYLPEGVSVTSYSKCLVTFVTNCDMTVPSQSLFAGEKATEPTGLTKTGYMLKGWYTSNYNSSDEYKWDFDKNTVDRDITLYAIWEGGCTVTFDTGCDVVVPSQTVKKGGKITKPTNPVREGFSFTGWYKSATSRDTSYLWNFDKDTVTYDITLYAGWKVEGNCTVTFDTGCDAIVSSQTVKRGGKITRPQNPVRTGYSFTGWYKSSTSRDASYLWDFENDTVTNDITLYAGWKVEGGSELDDPIGDDDPSDPDQILTPGEDGIYRYTLVLGEKYKVNIPGMHIMSLRSNDNKVVAVNQKGEVQGKKVGSTNVNCYVNGKPQTIRFTVVSPVICAADGYVLVGEKLEMSVKGTAIGKISWSVNNAKAQINSDGVLTGVSAGTVKVTATIHNRAFSVSIKVENPKFGKTSYTVKAGKSIKAKLSGTKQGMRAAYTIADESIAVVTADGKIAGLTPGTTTLTATLGEKTYTTKIVVE